MTEPAEVAGICPLLFGCTLALALLDGMLQRLEATRARVLDLYRSPRG